MKRYLQTSYQSLIALNSVLKHCLIGVYSTEAKQQWLLQRGRNSFVILRWLRRFLFYILQMISFRIASVKEMNLCLRFGKYFQKLLKIFLRKEMNMGKMVTRLVGIWEERRVFGSRAKSIKDVLLGEESPQPLEFTKKRSRSVKIVKRDSRSIRTKLTIGSKSGNDPKRTILSKELEEEENHLKQCIEKLKVVEANRLALVSQLRDALNDQESDLENVRTQMQVAQAQIDEAEYMRKWLNDENCVTDSKPSTATPPSADAKAGSKKSGADIAAEVADRLASSTSSQYIMPSVLSTFAAEEGLTKTTTVSNSFLINNSVSKPEYIPSQPYQTVLIPQATLIPNSQPNIIQFQIHILSNICSPLATL